MPYPGGKGFSVEKYMTDNQPEQDFCQKLMYPGQGMGVKGKRSGREESCIGGTQDAGQHSEENSDKKGQVQDCPQAALSVPAATCEGSEPASVI